MQFVSSDTSQENRLWCVRVSTIFPSLWQLCGKTVCEVNWECVRCNIDKPDAPACPENCPPVTKVLDIDGECIVHTSPHKRPLIPYTQTSPRRCQSINYLVLHNRECPQMNRYQNQTRTSPSPTWGHLPYGKPSAVNKWTCVRVRGCVLPYIVSFNLDSNIKLKNKYIFLTLCYSMAFHDLQHIRKLTQDHLPVNSCIYCWRSVTHLNLEPKTLLFIDLFIGIFIYFVGSTPGVCPEHIDSCLIHYSIQDTEGNITIRMQDQPGRLLMSKCSDKVS